MVKMVFHEAQANPFHINNYLNDQMKQIEFSQYWNQQATTYPSPQCLVSHILVQRSTLLVVTN